MRIVNYSECGAHRAPLAINILKQKVKGLGDKVNLFVISARQFVPSGFVIKNEMTELNVQIWYRACP